MFIVFFLGNPLKEDRPCPLFARSMTLNLTFPSCFLLPVDIEQVEEP